MTKGREIRCFDYGTIPRTVRDALVTNALGVSGRRRSSRLSRALRRVAATG